MKRYILLILVFLFYKASAQHTFNKLYNFCGDSTIIASSNNNIYADSNYFLAAGDTYTPGVSTLHSYLACFDYEGNLIWKQKILFPGKYNTLNYCSSCLQKLSNSLYVLAGGQIDFSVNTVISIDQPYVYIFNAHGDSIGFNKLVDSFCTRDIFSAATDAAGNIFTAGWILSKSLTFFPRDSTYQADSNALWVCKFDSIGHLIWQKSLLWQLTGTSGYIGIQKIIPSHDNNSLFITINYSKDSYTYPYYSHLIKMDTSGNIILDKAMRPTIQNFFDPLDIIPTADGNYAFAGSVADTLLPSVFPDSVWVYYGKFNDNGDTLWTRRFKTDKMNANQHTALKITEMADKRLAILGRKTYFTDIPFLLITDSIGQVLAYRDYSYRDTIPGLQYLCTLSNTKDGGLLMSGWISSHDTTKFFDTVGSLSWYVLADSFGCITGGCQAADSIWQTTSTPVLSAGNNSTIKIYPNPVNDVLYIDSKGLTNAQVIITDITGRMLIRHPLASQHEQVSLQQLPIGMYLYRIIDEGIVKTQGKVVKE